MFQFRSGIVGREVPVDLDLRSVADAFPRGDLRNRSVFVRQTTVKALTRENGQLNLRHVQPTAMPGRVRHFQLARQAFGLRRVDPRRDWRACAC